MGKALRLLSTTSSSRARLLDVVVEAKLAEPIHPPLAAPAVAGEAETSPRVGLVHVLVTLMTTLVVLAVIDAGSLMNGAKAMDPSWQRTVTLVVGQPALVLARVTHLDWPHNALDAALGRQQTMASAQSPLLAAPAMTIERGTQTVPERTATAAPSPSPTPMRPTVTAAPTAAPTAVINGVLLGSVGSLGGMEAVTTVVATATPVPVATATPTPRPSPSPTATPLPVHALSADHPLRLLVTGDSLTGYLGPELVDRVAALAPVVGFVDTHNGTGLTRPDYVDWSVVAQHQVDADNPDAVVIMIGGNDFQNMALGNGQVLTAGTPEWTAEYQRRAEVLLRIWTRNGTKRVYWLSIPPARNAFWASIDALINQAVTRATAAIPGATFINILNLVTVDGKYADFVPGSNGSPLLIREPDGVHLNPDGSAIVADRMLSILETEWHFGPAAK